MMAAGQEFTSTLVPATPAAMRAPMIRVLPGRPQSAAIARQFAQRFLGVEHPATETAMLLVSELVTNAVQHSRSGEPGGSVTVTLCPGPAGVLIQVHDDGGATEPRVTTLSADTAEHGYGLRLVEALAERWGTIVSPDGRITWCRVGGTDARTCV